MVEVRPFRSLEFAPGPTNLAHVVAPPHDVITERELAAYRKASPHNIVHLTLPMDRDHGKAVDKFEHAERLLTEWLAQGILRATPREVMYAYECVFPHRGDALRMRGVLVALRLDPTFKKVLPHEQIFPRFSDNRLKVLRATATDLEPIELVYSGKSADASLWAYLDGSQAAPDLQVRTADGALHQLWRVTDEAIMDTVQDGFKGRKVYIADGHHRYQAAVTYAEERRSSAYRPPRDAPWDYKLTLLVNTSEPGLLILPTHRILRKAAHQEPHDLVARWGRHFRVRPVALGAGNPVTALAESLEAPTDAPALGAWLGEPGTGYILEALQPVVPETLVPGKSRTFRSMDVVHLQHVALAEGVGIPEERWGDDVAYTRSDEEAVAWVRDAKAFGVLVPRPTRLAQLCAVADAGEKMPQKSTYFLPKIPSGFALYPIGKGSPEGKGRKVTS